MLDKRVVEMKRALVTGASTGIGRAIAVKLASEGFSVGINYAHNEDGAKETLSAVKDVGADGIVLNCDVSREVDVQAMAEAFLDAYGGIDVLVNNAGIYERKHITDMDIYSWNRTLAVNLTGPFLVIRAFLDAFPPEGGRIINITSMLASLGSAHGADYSASKAGLVGLTKSLARELGPRRITVNAVAPGPVDTNILASDTPEKRQERIDQTPLGRIGRPQDIAEMVAFLASDRAEHITGQEFHVNGGFYIG